MLSIERQDKERPPTVRRLFWYSLTICLLILVVGWYGQVRGCQTAQAYSSAQNLLSDYFSGVANRSQARARFDKDGQAVLDQKSVKQATELSSAFKTQKIACIAILPPIPVAPRLPPHS